MPEQACLSESKGRHDGWDAVRNQLQAMIQTILLRPALLSLFLGGVAALGFAPHDLWPLTLICVAAWMGLVRAAPTLKDALRTGWTFGFAHLTVANGWIQHAFTFQDAMPHWLGYLAPALLSVYLAIYPMLAAGLAWRFARAASDPRPGIAFVLAFAAAWIVTEWLRGTMLTGYPWSPLGVIWLPLPGVAQTARWIGTYALSGLTVAVAGSLLLLARARWRMIVVVGPIVALLILAGMAPLTVRDDPQAPRVRVVQPNLGEEARPTSDYAENNLRALEALAGRPGTTPRLIVWPEGALRYFIEDGYPRDAYDFADPRLVRRRIGALLGPHDILLAGGAGLVLDRDGAVTAATNSVYELDARGTILDRYDKAHLVPFGEYLPVRPLLSRIGLSRLVPGDLDFAPGPGPRDLALPGFGDVGVQICYEIIFSGNVVDEERRPAFLFNPSNDAWYGDSGPAQHLAQTRLRAIEEGLPIIRATPTGISAVVDADGRLRGTIGLHRAGVIDTVIPTAHAPTLFAKLGNRMAFIVGAALLLLAVAFRRSAR